MIFLAIAIACILSATLYRMGGAKGFNTKFRDLGCPAVLLALVMLLFGIHKPLLYLSFFVLSWMALSSYWDWLFGFDNFWFHGFMCGLAGVPLIWCGVPWWIILTRTAICTVGMGLASKAIDNAVIEELGRGFLFIL